MKEKENRKVCLLAFDQKMIIRLVYLLAWPIFIGFPLETLPVTLLSKVEKVRHPIYLVWRREKPCLLEAEPNSSLLCSTTVHGNEGCGIYKT